MSDKVEPGSIAVNASPQISPFELLEDARGMAYAEASRQCCIDKFSVIEDIYPCSATQTELLELSIEDAGGYITPLVYSLPGNIDIAKLKGSWETVAMRTPVLRTRFVEYGRSFLQVVIKDQLQWKFVTEETLECLIAAEKMRTAALGKLMSWHTILECTGSSEKYLIWTVHPSLMDDWSASQIASAVEEVYFGVDSPEISSVGFNSFIKYLSCQDSIAAKEFWTSQLVDASPPFFPRLPSLNYHPIANRSLEFGVQVAKQVGITTVAVIQAAWSLLVGMYSNSTDIVTGLTLNGRTAQLAEIEKIIGPTTTTVPFRTRLRGEQLLIEFLYENQNQQRDVISFGHYGLRNIKRISQNAETGCSFRNILVVRSGDEPAARKLLLSQRQRFRSLDCALLMECEVLEDNIKLRATFDDKMLNVIEVDRIFRQFEYLLRAVSLADPLSKVSDIQTICQADMQQIQQWNSNAPEPFRDCVHHLIERIVESQPDATAIDAWDGKLSYRELDEASSRLASHLANHYSIRPESLVPVCFEKSKWVVVAMLAVLKASGAFVPLDPEHPIVRLKSIIHGLGKDNADLVLTSTLHSSRAAKIGSRILTLHADLLNDIPGKLDTLDTKTTPDNAAYVIFTSGSTGVPKGILIEHKSLCSGARTHGEFIQLGRHSRTFQFATHSFDISMSDIFTTLIYGGCICIPSEYDRVNNLAGAIRASKADYVSLTPTVAAHLQPEDVPGLKIVVCVGEPMTEKVIKQWAEHVNLINMYGPAETTIYCSGKANLKLEDTPSCIGRGVGAVIWIVDPEDSDKLRPIGGVGELLIEGPNVGRGYLENETQTLSSFIKAPTWCKPSHSVRRFYKTGDLAFYDCHGSINFVGRNDGQVKIRGQRLEIGEVERRLRDSLPQSAEAAVSVVAPGHGQSTLAAFLVITNNEDDKSEISIVHSPASLQQFQALIGELEGKLCKTLPTYMVPTLFVPISKLPLSTSGKLDRKKLQNIAADLSFDQLSSLSGIDTTVRKFRPSTEVEKRIKNLWKRLLHVPKIKIEDNFFRLGGDSVTAMRLVGMARKENLLLTVDQVFKCPILSNMAASVQSGCLEKTSVVLPFSLLGNLDVSKLREEASSQCNIRQDQVDDLYPCTQLQEDWIQQPNTAQFVFIMPKTLDVRRFCAALHAVIQSQPLLRTRLIKTASSGCFQVVIDEPGEVLERMSLDEYLRQDKQAVISFGHCGQRFCIVDVEGTNKKYFVLTANHFTFDGWSLGLLFKEIEYRYLQKPSPRNGEVQFNLFVKHINDIDKNAARDFWVSHLAGAVTKPLCNAPNAFGSFACLEPTEATIEIVMPIIKGSDVTVSIVVEVAMAIVISRIVRSPDVVFRSLRSGRSAPINGIEDIIGPTAAVIPLRVHNNLQQKTRDLLLDMQNFEAASVPFEHFGWKAISDLSPKMATNLSNCVAINILPFVEVEIETLGNGIGLKIMNAYEDFRTPFCILCRMGGEKMRLGIISDKTFISEERVDTLLRHFEYVFQRVIDSQLEVEQTLGDIDIAAIPDNTGWSCTRVPVGDF